MLELAKLKLVEISIIRQTSSTKIILKRDRLAP
jgi:hypothetical protein